MLCDKGLSDSSVLIAYRSQWPQGSAQQSYVIQVAHFCHISFIIYSLQVKGKAWWLALSENFEFGYDLQERIH